MIEAKKAGIDAFALNIGIDDFTTTQLDHAYASAAKNGMSVFISFDFNWYQITQAAEVASMLSNYVNESGQLKVGGKAFVSSFQGDGLDLDTVREKVQSDTGIDLFIVPNFRPGSLGSADGLFNWMAWPNDGNNKAPDGTNMSVAQGDDTYQQSLGKKPYMAPVSPWFSTHFGLEVPYSKNWVFPSDILWYDRWNQVLTLESQYLEIITWNDYGESHYVGPLSSPHVDDGNSKWVNDMPHTGWLEMAAPYISAFHAGDQKPDAYIKQDKLIYWYRPTPKDVECDATDTCQKPWPSPSPTPNYYVGKPNGYDTMTDQVFVVALLTQPGTVTITSGLNSKSFEAPAGASSWSLAMGVGKQSFELKRGSQSVLSGTSLKEIVNECVCGIYNFNAYVGTLPPGPADALQADGLKSFTYSLSAQCAPTPSLGMASAAGPVVFNTGASSGLTSASNSMWSSISASASAYAPNNVVPTKMPSAQPAKQQQQQQQQQEQEQEQPPPPPPTPTTPQQPQTPSALERIMTITASEQIAPTNCLQPGSVWAGPVGQAAPDKCDVS
ncbi:MAG: hypothetical protein Q9217_004995 [Psora testacea]